MAKRAWEARKFVCPRTFPPKRAENRQGPADPGLRDDGDRRRRGERAGRRCGAPPAGPERGDQLRRRSAAGGVSSSIAPQPDTSYGRVAAFAGRVDAVGKMLAIARDRGIHPRREGDREAELAILVDKRS